jgi:hypothetical protein
MEKCDDSTIATKTLIFFEEIFSKLIVNITFAVL